MGLSREQSSSSEGLLFSASDVEESDNEEETDKQKNANLDTILDFVPCSQPDSDEGTSHHDHSPLKNLEDASVNRSGRPVRAASLGVAQYLVAAKEAASSRACVEAGPRGLRTKSQKRTVSQTAMRRSQAESCMPGSGVVQTHFLCPLDTHCFRPMKQVFVKVFDGHMNSYKSDMDRFVKEFGEVYNKGLTENNLRNGFADLGLWPPAWPKISEKLDGYRNREAMQKAEDDAQDAAIREELAVAAAERPIREVRVVVEWDPDMHAPVPSSPSAASPRPPATPAVSNRSSSTSTSVGASPPGMTAAGTQVSPGLKVRQRLWKKKPDAPGYHKPRRLDIVLVQGGELTGDEVVQDLQVEVDEKEQKKVEAERRKREREQKWDEKRKEEEERKRKQEERKRAAEEKKQKAAEDKQRRDAERAEAKRKKEEERAATQASRPRRGTKRKAPEPDMWDDGTTCPCGQDVGTGKTENWAQCDACDGWIHDGCFGTDWGRDGPYIEQSESRWQCSLCAPRSDDDSDGDSQPNMAGSDSQ